MLKSYAIKVEPNFNDYRYDVYVTHVFSDVSRKKIKSIIDSGGAYLNKKRIHLARTKVKANDIVEFYFDSIHSNSKAHQFSYSDLVVAKTKNYVVVNKPPGVPSQPTISSRDGTILHILSECDPQEFDVKNLFLVHRLDKETSGLMIIARNPDTRKYFETLFRERKVKKTYQALCFGLFNQNHIDLKSEIYKDTSRPNAYLVSSTKGKKSSTGKFAHSKFVLVENFPNFDAALVKCYPTTGRTHQLRVQLCSIGHPIIGDKTYAQNTYGHPCQQIAPRHMLHASELEFLDEKSVVVKCFAPLPNDFKNCLEKVKPKRGVNNDVQVFRY